MSENKPTNGKGDKWRKTDLKKYYKRYDEIDWGKKSIDNRKNRDNISK